MIDDCHKLIHAQLCEYRNVNIKNKVEFPIISKPKPCIRSSDSLPVFLKGIDPWIRLGSAVSQLEQTAVGRVESPELTQCRGAAAWPKCEVCPLLLNTWSPMMILLLGVVESLGHRAMLEEVDL